IQPATALPEDAACKVTILAAQIHDTDNNDPPDGLTADYSFSFHTDAAPRVVATIPTNGARDVGQLADVVISFSEPVTSSSEAFKLQCPSGQDVTVSLTGSGSESLRARPLEPLPAGTACEATVLRTGIRDVDTGDPPDTLTADF